MFFLSLYVVAKKLFFLQLTYLYSSLNYSIYISNISLSINPWMRIHFQTKIHQILLFNQRLLCQHLGTLYLTGQKMIEKQHKTNPSSQGLCASSLQRRNLSVQYILYICIGMFQANFVTKTDPTNIVRTFIMKPINIRILIIRFYFFSSETYPCQNH